MDKRTRENWVKVLEALEGAGKTDCHIYRRAQAIVNGDLTLVRLAPCTQNHDH